MNRIAHIFEGPQTAGAITVMKQLLDQMDRTQFEPVLIAAVPGKFVDILTREGYKVHILDSKTGEHMRTVLSEKKNRIRGLAELYGMMKKESRQLRLLLESEKVNVLHSHHHHHHLLSAMACRRDIATVWHLHAIINPRSLFGLQWRIFNYYAARYVSRVIAISTAVKESMALKVQAKTEIVFDGIRTSDFGIDQVEVIKRSWGFSKDDVIIGAVGRFVFIKGFHDFISMAAIVKGKFPSVKFVLIGPTDINDETQYLNERIKQIEDAGLKDRFKLLGSLDNPAVFMQGLDVLVLPTVTREGFGLVALEAQASGKPVVATDCGGPRDIVIDGETGFIVPRADVQAMSDRVCRLLADTQLLQKMRKASRERATMPQFDAMTMVRKIEHIYRTLIN